MDCCNSVLKSNCSLAVNSLYKTVNKLIKTNERMEYEEIFNFWEYKSDVRSKVKWDKLFTSQNGYRRY